MLTPDDFAAFFEEVHGYEPFPWQVRLLMQVAGAEGQWPKTLDLPTGSGKTAAIDVAVFHLALEADRGQARRAPVRIAFVVDRRLVVDDAFGRARKLADALKEARTPVVARVAGQLRKLSGDGPPLIARPLRGGIPREDDWTRTPAQPTVLCSTVDQVGSRLLFRGYGVSDSMKPVHAGLLGADCLILLDEAHLAEPFRQTLEWYKIYRGSAWREESYGSPGGVVHLTATPGEVVQTPFSLAADDRTHPVLARRLGASKLARLVSPGRSTSDTSDAESVDDADDGREQAKDLERRVVAILAEVKKALQHFEESGSGAPAPAIGVVVNRVARARAVHERIVEEVAGDLAVEPILMIGAARPVDRDDLAARLEPIKTRTWQLGESRTLGTPVIVVATQCIEAGVDVDFDGLITELAPLDALRQRFGRLNRSGRDVKPYAAIVVAKADTAARYVDPVYGATLRPTWDALQAIGKDNDQTVEFGIDGFSVKMTGDTLAPKADAPVLLPAHLALLKQTSPVPATDPDIALYLHGPSRQPDSITVAWRADIDPRGAGADETRTLLTLMPPRSTEAIELPLWAVSRWLKGGGRLGTPGLADVAGDEPKEEQVPSPGDERMVFRWRGDDDRSRWVHPKEIRPGDTIVVPSRYGGLDQFGWKPESQRAVDDIASRAAAPFAGRRMSVRVAPGLLDGFVEDERLAESLAAGPSRRWRELRARLLELPLPDHVRSDLLALREARRGRVLVELDLYGRDELGRPRGVVFVAPLGIKGQAEQRDSQASTTESDLTGSMPGFPLGLKQHNHDVGKLAGSFAQLAGLPPERISDLSLAGSLHDLGKADPRFQAWLHYGDPLGSDPTDTEQFLAKSARPLPRSARTASGLPSRWRHEALSVRKLVKHQALADASDADLVLWLVGTHHGHGRPLFPHHDPEEHVPDIGPQSLAFDWNGLDWAALFERLCARYGAWELARMEAIIRLADHRASEAAALEARAE